MEYIIKVCGEVVDYQYKAYAVKANSEAEAKNIAKQNFQEEFLADGNVAVVEKPFMRKKRSIFALVAMIIPILLSLINWKHGHSTISISPDLISCIFGVLIYSSFVIRFKGIQRTVQSKTDILFAIVSVLLLSTFVRIFLLDTKFTLLGGLIKVPVNTYVVLVFAVILSWIGLKGVSLTCIGFIVLCALGNILGLNKAMGPLLGTVYVISSLFGILMYLSIEPVFIESKNSLYRFANKSINYLNGDLSQAKKQVSEVKKLIDKK